MRRLLRNIAIAAAALAAVFVVLSGAAYLLVDPGALARKELAAQLPALSKKLGRNVTVGGVSASFLPLSVALHDLKVDDAESVAAADRRPLLQAHSIGVKVALLDALLSLGKKVRVTDVTLDGLSVSVLRRADGSLSYEDVLASTSAGPSPVGPAPEEHKSAITGVVIDRVAVRDASIHLEDAGAHTSADVRKLNLTLRNVGLERPVMVALDLAAFAGETNVWVDAEVGPVPEDLDIDEPLALLRALHLKTSKVELATLAPYLRHLPLRPESLKLTSDVTLALLPGKPLFASGIMELGGVQLEGGERFDVSLAQDATLDREAGSLDLRKLELAVGAVKLSAHGRVAGIGKPLSDLRLSDLEVKSDSLDVGQLLRYVPVKDPPFTTEGAGKLSISATGKGTSQALLFALDLSAPRVIVPDRLDKPAGVPMSIEAEGTLDEKTAALPKLSLRFGPVVIDGAVRVDDYRTASAHTALTLGSNTWSFGDLARLVPAVQKGVPKGTSIGGTGALSVKYDGAPNRIDLDASLDMKDLALAMPGTQIQGGARLAVTAKGDPEGELQLDATAAARDAALEVAGEVDKPAGVPLDLGLSVHRSGDKLEVKKASLVLGALSISGSGTIDSGDGSVDVDLAMPPLDVAALARTFPALKESGIAGGRVTAKLSMEGNPRQPATMGVVLDDFRYSFGKNDVRGTLHLRDLGAPKIEADLDIPRFYADEVMPEGKGEKEAAAARTRSGAPARPACVPPSPWLKKVSANLNLKLADGRFSGVPVKNLDAHVELRDGRLNVDRFSFKSYGGTVDGHGTHLDLGSCIGEYMADLSLENVDLAALLAEQTSLGGKVLSGRMSGRVVVNGKGADRYHMMIEDPAGRRLGGIADVKIENAAWSSGSLGAGALGKLGQMVPGLRPGESHALGTVNASFDVKNGRFNLSEPMSITTGDSRTELTGSVGMDHDLALTGTYFTKPAQLAAATGGRCKPAADVPVPLTIGGTLETPRIAAGDAGKSAGALLQACLGGQVAELKEQLGEAAAKKAAKKLLKGIGF